MKQLLPTFPRRHRRVADDDLPINGCILKLGECSFCSEGTDDLSNEEANAKCVLTAAIDTQRNNNI
jgi:hypothetical protein